MSNSKNRDEGSVLLIMLIIAILALVLAINYQSLFSAFISGFIFCALLEDHLKSKRELEEYK